MLDFLRRIFRSKRYRIIHDPKLGYLPLYFEGGFRWWTIEKSGATSVSELTAVNYPELWHSTIEAAGALINLHATRRGQTTVWSA